MPKSTKLIIAIALVLSLFFLVFPASAATINGVGVNSSWIAITGGYTSGYVGADGLYHTASGQYYNLNLTPGYFDLEFNMSLMSYPATLGTLGIGYTTNPTAPMLNIYMQAGTVKLSYNNGTQYYGNAYAFTDYNVTHHWKLNYNGQAFNLYLDGTLISSIGHSGVYSGNPTGNYFFYKMTGFGGGAIWSNLWYDDNGSVGTSGYNIQGTVIDANSKAAIGGAYVNVSYPDNGTVIASTKTFSDGTYAIAMPVVAGNFNLNCSASTYYSSVIGFTNTSSFDSYHNYNCSFSLTHSTFRTNAGLFIYAIDNSTGYNVYNSNFTLWTNSSSSKALIATYNGTGGYAGFSQLPGNYYLTITAKNYTNFSGWVNAPQAQDYGFIEYMNQSYNGAYIALIDVYVVDTNGLALPEALVNMNYTSNNTLAFTGTTDSLGHVRASLPPDAYNYWVSLSGYQLLGGVFPCYGNQQYTEMVYMLPSYSGPGGVYNDHVTIKDQATGNLIVDSSTTLVYTDMFSGVSNRVFVPTGSITLQLNVNDTYNVALTSNGYYSVSSEFEIFTGVDSPFTMTKLPSSPTGYSIQASNKAPMQGVNDVFQLLTPINAKYDEVDWFASNSMILNQTKFKLINGVWNVYIFDNPNTALQDGTWYPCNSPPTIDNVAFKIPGSQGVTASVYYQGQLLATPSNTVNVQQGAAYTVLVESFDAIYYTPLNNVLVAVTDKNTGIQTAYTLNNNQSITVTRGDMVQFVFGATGYDTKTETYTMNNIYTVDCYLYPTGGLEPTPNPTANPSFSPTPTPGAGGSTSGTLPTLSDTDKSTKLWSAVDFWLNPSNLYLIAILVFLAGMMAILYRVGGK